MDAAEFGTVAVVTKTTAMESNTRYAQGGICAVLDEGDTVDAHAEDTQSAGANLCDPAAVRVVCSEGASAVRHLVRVGAQFTGGDDGTLHLAREGGIARSASCTRRTQPGRRSPARSFTRRSSTRT